MNNATVESLSQIRKTLRSRPPASSDLASALRAYGLPEGWVDTTPFAGDKGVKFVDSSHHDLVNYHNGETVVEITVLYHDAVGRAVRTLTISYRGDANDLRLYEVHFRPGTLTPNVRYFSVENPQGRSFFCDYFSGQGTMSINLPLFTRPGQSLQYFDGKAGKLNTHSRVVLMLNNLMTSPRVPDGLA